MAQHSRHRIMAVASAGGHWIQLARLSEAFAGSDTLYVTTVGGQVAPSGNRSVAHIADGSRNEPLRLLLAALQLCLLMVRFRPHALLTTGAAPGYVALRLAKLFGARTVWIDSIANAEELSLSGKLAGRHADLWLTQWESLEAAGPRYWGQVL